MKPWCTKRRKYMAYPREQEDALALVQGHIQWYY